MAVMTQSGSRVLQPRSGCPDKSAGVSPLHLHVPAELCGAESVKTIINARKPEATLYLIPQAHWVKESDIRSALAKEAGSAETPEIRRLAKEYHTAIMRAVCDVQADIHEIVADMSRRGLRDLYLEGYGIEHPEAPAILHKTTTERMLTLKLQQQADEHRETADHLRQRKDEPLLPLVGQLPALRSARHRRLELQAQDRERKARRDEDYAEINKKWQEVMLPYKDLIEQRHLVLRPAETRETNAAAKSALESGDTQAFAEAQKGRDRRALELFMEVERSDDKAGALCYGERHSEHLIDLVREHNVHDPRNQIRLVVVTPARLRKWFPAED